MSSRCATVFGVALLLANLIIAGSAAAADFTVRTINNEFAYTINSVGGTPPLTLVRGQTYTFDVSTCSCHPFQILGAPNGSVVNNNISSGTIVFAVPATAVNYTYRCSIHLFGNTITTVALSANADLSSLTLSSGVLSPFGSDATSYAADVPNATSSVTITPAVAQPNASITINGSAALSGAGSVVSLHTGSNTITILVTAQDGITNQTYTLIMTRVTNLNTWRQNYFPGSTSTTGPGADTATPQNDGIDNLVKFAIGMDPTQPGIAPGNGNLNGANLTFAYTPSAAAVADGLIFRVEYSDTLGAGSWAADIVDQGTLGSGGSLVTATVPMGASIHRFLRLTVVSP